MKPNAYKGKYPRRIRAVHSIKGKPGTVQAVLNNGEKHEIHASNTGGIMPHPGEDIEKYAGQTTRYMVEQWTICGGWENNWSEDDQPQTFATEAEAQAEIDEFMDDIAAEIAAGNRAEDEGYDREEFRIVPVQKDEDDEDNEDAQIDDGENLNLFLPWYHNDNGLIVGTRPNDPEDDYNRPDICDFSQGFGIPEGPGDLRRADFVMNCVNLVLQISRLNYDGEELPGGGEYLMENDDAVDTVNSLIQSARHIINPKTEA